jgi:hypothetical protein
MAQFTPDEDLAVFLMRKPANESELEKLKKLSKVHPLGALLSVTAYLEGKTAEFTKAIGLDQSKMGYHGPWLNLSATYLNRFGIDVPVDVGSGMEDIRRLRNYAAHGRKDPTREEVSRAIDIAEKYERFLDSIDKEKARQAVGEYISGKRKSEQSDQQPAPVETEPGAAEP